MRLLAKYQPKMSPNPRTIYGKAAIGCCSHIGCPWGRRNPIAARKISPPGKSTVRKDFQSRFNIVRTCVESGLEAYRRLLKSPSLSYVVRISSFADDHIFCLAKYASRTTTFLSILLEGCQIHTSWSLPGGSAAGGDEAAILQNCGFPWENQASASRLEREPRRRG